MTRSRPTIAAMSIVLATVSGAALGQLPLSLVVDDQDLAALRGGFLTSAGLHIDFSLQNLVVLNGQAVVQSVIGPTASGALSSWAVSSPGAGSPLANLPAGTTIMSSGLQTIVQNSLDNQAIQSLKVLNIELSNLAGLRSIGLQHRIDHALADSLR